MANKIKRPWKFFRNTLLLCLLAIILFSALRIYLGDYNDAFTKKVSQTLHLPIAFSAGRAITFNTYYWRLALAENVAKKNLDQAQKNAILQQLKDDAWVQKLLTQRNITVSKEQVDEYYKLLQKLTFTSDFDFEKLAISNADFKLLLVRPELERVKLQIELAKDHQQNTEAYVLAERLLGLIKKGAKFSDLAQQYSADQQSAQIGGEMGFVGYNDVVPEIYRELANTKDREPHAVASRFGLHVYIVKAEDSAGPDKSKRYNFQQIFLKTVDFEQWFAKQKSK